jgi:hypothetical protein
LEIRIKRRSARPPIPTKSSRRGEINQKRDKRGNSV